MTVQEYRSYLREHFRRAHLHVESKNTSYTSRLVKEWIPLFDFLLDTKLKAFPHKVDCIGTRTLVAGNFLVHLEEGHSLQHIVEKRCPHSEPLTLPDWQPWKTDNGLHWCMSAVAHVWVDAAPSLQPQHTTNGSE